MRAAAGRLVAPTRAPPREFPAIPQLSPVNPPLNCSSRSHSYFVSAPRSPVQSPYDLLSSFHCGAWSPPLFP
ncbi:hypothetical protein EV646_108141 [Kribbella antiqua]|uniref:Uncharacterized protein n=1 Tax=Kribbella antiqua TaxID=2512217 RepID=A0A4R2INE4_9ACTN|nr:hypothetical protein EV646_108141 [Kribbella antiqua]